MDSDILPAVKHFGDGGEPIVQDLSPLGEIKESSNTLDSGFSNMSLIVESAAASRQFNHNDCADKGCIRIFHGSISGPRALAAEQKRLAGFHEQEIYPNVHLTAG